MKSIADRAHRAFTYKKIVIVIGIIRRTSPLIRIIVRLHIAFIQRKRKVTLMTTPTRGWVKDHTEFGEKINLPQILVCRDVADVTCRYSIRSHTCIHSATIHCNPVRLSSLPAELDGRLSDRRRPEPSTNG